MLTCHTVVGYSTDVSIRFSAYKHHLSSNWSLNLLENCANLRFPRKFEVSQLYRMRFYRKLCVPISRFRKELLKLTQPSLMSPSEPYPSEPYPSTLGELDIHPN
jgi:hypothetical protein